MDEIQVDLLVDKGSDFAVQLYWTDQYDDPLVVTNPMKMTVGMSPTVTYISSADAPVGGQLTYMTFNSENGFVQLSLPDAHTNALTVGQYPYDLWVHVSDPDDLVNTTKRVRLFGGKFIVRASTTTF